MLKGSASRPSVKGNMKHETMDVQRLLKHLEKLEIRDVILYRQSKDYGGKRRYQLVVPPSLKAEVLKGTHDDAAYQGQAMTLHIVRQRFFGLVWTSRSKITS